MPVNRQSAMAQLTPKLSVCQSATSDNLFYVWDETTSRIRASHISTKAEAQLFASAPALLEALRDSQRLLLCLHARQIEVAICGQHAIDACPCATAKQYRMNMDLIVKPKEAIR